MAFSAPILPCDTECANLALALTASLATGNDVVEMSAMRRRAQIAATPDDEARARKNVLRS